VWIPYVHEDKVKMYAFLNGFMKTPLKGFDISADLVGVQNTCTILLRAKFISGFLLLLWRSVIKSLVLFCDVNTPHKFLQPGTKYSSIHSVNLEL
jgi:hypothetical protein